MPLLNLPDSFFLSPHGLSIWKGSHSGDQSQSPRLFVVNHLPHDLDTIEIFRISLSPLSLFVLDLSLEREREGTDLRCCNRIHVETIMSDTFISLNDVAATGPRSFFATNDMGSPRSAEFSRLLEMLIPGKIVFSRGSVVHFDGKQSNFVLVHQRMANGIEVSPDHSKLFVAETLSNQIGVYEINYDHSQDSPLTLSLLETIETGTGVDNFQLDLVDPNVLYVGCHPRLFDFVGHAIFHTFSPSEILKIRLATSPSSSPSTVERLALLHGSVISASSVGGIFDGLLIIAPVFDPHILVCEPKKL